MAVGTSVNPAAAGGSTTSSPTGMFETFPRLRGGCIEQGALWTVPWLKRLELAVEGFSRTEPALRLPRPASEYVHGHLWFTPFPNEPVGWMIDRLGKPLTDPKRADEGMLLPLGGMEAGYKGYGLAMIIGLLAGTLGGAAMGKDVIDFNHDDASVTNTGHAIAAINIAAFIDIATFKSNVDTLVRDFRASRRMPGVAWATPVAGPPS